jgi:SAM-dependent methyltransferase
VTAPRKYLRFDLPTRAPTKLQLAVHLLRGLLLFPYYWLAAAALGCPGMQCRGQCFRLGMRLLGRGDFADAYRCIVWPLDSVRYFEFDFFWKVIHAFEPKSLLDISSPRLFLATTLAANQTLVMEGINPDEKDLRRTAALLGRLGFAARCTLSGRGVADVASVEGQFDLVTCMSVLEHIVDDLGAIEIMWSKVAPGGSLVVSMPCAAAGWDEYTNVDEYGLLERDTDGFVFWQRYYDPARLAAVFAITGAPVSMSIFGERAAGLYDADVRAKRSNPRFPRWREPFNLVRAFRRYADLSSLPGMGVMALQFRKQRRDEDGR